MLSTEAWQLLRCLLVANIYSAALHCTPFASLKQLLAVWHWCLQMRHAAHVLMPCASCCVAAVSETFAFTSVFAAHVLMPCTSRRRCCRPFAGRGWWVWWILATSASAASHLWVSQLAPRCLRARLRCALYCPCARSPGGGPSASPTNWPCLNGLLSTSVQPLWPGNMAPLAHGMPLAPTRAAHAPGACMHTALRCTGSMGTPLCGTLLRPQTLCTGACTCCAAGMWTSPT